MIVMLLFTGRIAPAGLCMQNHPVSIGALCWAVTCGGGHLQQSCLPAFHPRHCSKQLLGVFFHILSSLLPFFPPSLPSSFLPSFSFLCSFPPSLLHFFTHSLKELVMCATYWRIVGSRGSESTRRSYSVTLLRSSVNF